MEKRPPSIPVVIMFTVRNVVSGLPSRMRRISVVTAAASLIRGCIFPRAVVF
jgi:hypothetical protein